MNCKPGDLAIITRDGEGLRGFRDRIVKLKDQPPHTFSGVVVWEFEDTVAGIATAFVRDPLGTLTAPGQTVVVYAWPDDSLRPIRDQPGDDETLAWAGRPKVFEVRGTRSTPGVLR